MAVTRIKNNQITDNTIEYPKIKDGTLVGTKFNANITLNSNVTIIGNLQVSGNTTTVNSIDTLVSDPLITLNNGYVGAPAYDVGLLFNRALGTLNNYGGVNAALVWSESDGAFIVVLTTETGSTQGTINRTFQANLIAGNVNVSNLLVAETVRITSLDVGAVHTELLMSSSGNIVANSGTTSPIGVYTQGAVVVTDEGGVAIGGNLNVRGLSNFNGNITAGNLFVTGNINAVVGAVASQYGVFYGDENGHRALYAGVTNATFLPNVVVQVTGNVDSYSQVNFQNTNTGAYASADIVVTADDGTDTTKYVDLGIANSNYNYPGYEIIHPYDGYLDVATGNLVLYLQNSGYNMYFYTGGTTTTNQPGFDTAFPQITLEDGIGTLIQPTTESVDKTTGALRVLGGVGILGNLHATAINDTPIGNTKPSTGVFTNINTDTLYVNNFSSPNVWVTGGYADNFPIGANIKATGAFTTLTSNDLTTFTNATNSDTTGDGAVVVTGGVGIGGNLNVGGNTVIQGNLTVQGDITSLNVATLDVEDLNITVAKGAINSMAADGAGLTVDGAGATILYVSADDSWTLNKRVNLFELIVANINATHSNATTSYAGNFSSPNVVITGGYINDLANLTATTTYSANFSSPNVVITGGYINDLANLTSTTTQTTNFSTGNARITGGYADNFPLGMNVAAPATFTTANSTIVNSETLTTFTLNATNGNITTLHAGNFNSPNVAITGGYADNMPIGSNVPAPGAFTTITTTSALASSGNLVISSGTVNPVGSTTEGALVLTGEGGAAIGGNVTVMGGMIINHSQLDTAGHRTIIQGVNDSTLLYAAPSTVYDQVAIGGNMAGSSLTNGAKLAIYSTDTVLLPVGTTAQRPSGIGFSDEDGMIRYNSTKHDIEYYSVGEWRVMGNVFTTITQRTFQSESGDPNGNIDGSNDTFILPIASSTNATLVSINGVMQIPSIAYSVSGTSLIFTEPPSPGDVIDTRVMVTTQAVTTIASPNGYNQFDANNTYLSFYSGNLLLGSIENWRIDSSGDFYPVHTANIGASTNRVATTYVTNINQTGTTTVNSTKTFVAPTNTDTVTRFDKTIYSSGKILVELSETSGTHFQSSEVLIVQNGTVANITAVSSWTSAANLATFSANISGGFVYLNASSAGANLTVKAYPTLVKIG